MQLPPDDEIVLVSGLAPIRAKKLRHYEDANFISRLLPSPRLGRSQYFDRPGRRQSDWSGMMPTTILQAPQRIFDCAEHGTEDDSDSLPVTKPEINHVLAPEKRLFDDDVDEAAL
jgi:type IV secretion system protein VirD4